MFDDVMELGEVQWSTNNTENRMYIIVTTLNALNLESYKNFRIL